MQKLFICCIITAILAGCGPSQKALDAKEDALFNKWLNHSKAQLVQTWGEPDSIVTKANGGQILIYKEGVDFISVMNEKYTGSEYSFRKEMYINKDSLIYYWRAFRRK